MGIMHYKVSTSMKKIAGKKFEEIVPGSGTFDLSVGPFPPSKV